MPSRFIGRSLTLVGVIIVLAVGSRASTSGDQVRPANASPDVLPSLLVEVRGVRAARSR
jgi:hypothetical protein